MAVSAKMKIALAESRTPESPPCLNQLTGLNQKIGNFPGVTVDKRTGICQLDDSTSAEIIDLPGTYSLYPEPLTKSGSGSFHGPKGCILSGQSGAGSRCH